MLRRLHPLRARNDHHLHDVMHVEKRALTSDARRRLFTPVSKRSGRGVATVRQVTVGRTKTRLSCADYCPSAHDGSENIMFKRLKQLAEKRRLARRRTQPQPEEDFGGGDFCSLQEQPSTDDDQPLD